ncbi:Zinc-type alcohol dehydrogenase-like protein C16A3.02c [Colletotrichum tanaceti]|uniref:Zinc-type alcohol dehydrogenase-like protein C16A3.02c n=1 Tax=Colletotrichum tanaceti TaxID=1306861 RepID=A0A4U6XSG7_9PEZI|nr:Zinc-type alcohol dehydrogenase-like protein C16A3.02c [Colletotrichum tanaceti]TKW58834.1 Zinc-type alcohol dehydrogenase-like protein C16A3.02c [Colletotrichum tanaceti]
MAQDLPTEMRRWQVASPGAFVRDLALVTVPTPAASSLKPNQVLVQVVAAGINPADYKFPDLGLVAKAIISFPRCPGMDFAGRAVAVGPAVTDIAPGDLVVGRLDPMAAQGSLSEYTIADRDGIASVPTAGAAPVDLEQAAALGTAALTAYQNIVPYVKAGDKVFINGGSGGTGTFGIQIAKAVGCHVTVSCSTAKADLCRSLGADDVIDYKTADVVADLRARGNVFAVVVDNVGNSPPNLYKASDDFLLPGGHFKFVGGAVSLAQARSLVPGLLLPAFLGGARHKFEIFFTKNSHDDLARIAAWVAEGKVRTVVDSTFEFEDAVKAYEKLKQGSAAGKIIVRVAKKA